MPRDTHELLVWWTETQWVQEALHLRWRICRQLSGVDSRGREAHERIYVANDSTRLSGSILKLAVAESDTYTETGELGIEDYEEDELGESFDGDE